jgi:DNA-binding transcriptional regulator WhiA
MKDMNLDLLLYYPFINHAIEFIFSMEWSLKLYSIIKFKYFSFRFNLHVKEEKHVFVHIIKKTLILSFGKNLDNIWKIKNDVCVMFEMKNHKQNAYYFFCHNKWDDLVVNEFMGGNHQFPPMTWHCYKSEVYFINLNHYGTLKVK